MSVAKLLSAGASTMAAQDGLAIIAERNSEEARLRQEVEDLRRQLEEAKQQLRELGYGQATGA